MKNNLRLGMKQVLECYHFNQNATQVYKVILKFIINRDFSVPVSKLGTQALGHSCPCSQILIECSRAIGETEEKSVWDFVLKLHSVKCSLFAV